MKKNNLALKIAVLSISLLMLAPSALSVAVPNMREAYPNVSPSLIDLTLTLPFLLEIPFSFIASFLSTKMKKKQLIAIAVILVIIGGIGPRFIGSFTGILILRGILGAGVGMILPMASGLIPVYFEPQEFPKLFGAQAVVLNVGGIAFTYVAGWLVMTGWKNIFWIYLIGFIVLVITTLILPEPKAAETAPEAGGAQAGAKPKFSKTFYLYLFLVFILGIGIYCAFTNTATYIVGKGIGNSAQIGTVLTMLSLGGLVLGFIFSHIFKLCGRFTAAFGALLFGGSYILLAFSNSIVMCAVATFLMGIGGNVLSVLLSTLTPSKVDQQSATAAMGILMACMFAGEFVSPFVITFLTGIVGLGDEQSKFLLVGIATLIFMVISLIVKAPKRSEAA